MYAGTPTGQQQVILKRILFHVPSYNTDPSLLAHRGRGSVERKLLVERYRGKEEWRKGKVKKSVGVGSFAGASSHFVRVCVCVCVRARACACMRACVCV